MLKRMLLLLLALLLALPAAAEEPLLEQYAAQAAQELPLLAGNEHFAALYTGYWDDGVHELLAGYAAQTWQRPIRDVYLGVDEAELDAMIKAKGVKLDESTEEYLNWQIPMLVYSQLTFNRSYEALIAGAIVGTTLRYTDPAQPEGMMAFIRFFEDGDPLLYSINCVDGAVALSCGVLPEDEQSDDVQVKIYGADMSDELMAELIEQGVMTIQEIPPEEQAEKLAIADCSSAEDVNRWLKEREIMCVIASDEPIVLDVKQGIEKGATHAETAIRLVEQSAQRIGDQELMLLMTGDVQMTQQLSLLGSGDYSRPRLMVEVPVEVKTHGSLVWGMSATMALAAAEEGDPALRAMRWMLPDALINSLVNAQLRAEDMALLSISTYGGMYADPDHPDGNGMYLLLYEDGHTVCVTWACQNGAAVMQAKFLTLRGLSECQTAMDVTLWLMQQGIPVVCNEIPIN